ncbi:type IV secretory system conjugative DNA transfer family protein [Cetobacterium sp. 2A]|uniref:type IV secretory system conjugative DNA transfer family protein n=1 Tax=Cetobacterium sp. 2A TaxID=2754723 RepID=UPI00163CF7D1|nr:type IV secretory system conjugative DNA transfer family protein [Cetobacterium sp. 2A]MBC2857031.1 type IV secretory system conjugative DNA transfer family protein [Cetobacterium sp. 2A]
MKKIKLLLIGNLVLLMFLNNLFALTLANKYKNLDKVINPVLVLRENKYKNKEGIYLNPTLIFSERLNINPQEIFQKVYIYLSLGFILILIYKKKELTTHGSSKFAENEEIKRFGLIGNNDGVVLGMSPNNEMLTQNGSEHIMVMAPTRSGKGVNTVLPTLWTWAHSVVINDIKGECWDLTSGYRRSVLKHKCIFFNPIDDTGEGISYNPLAMIGIGQSSEAADVGTISVTLLDVNDKGEDSHWITSAINLLTAVILHLMYVNKESSFIDVINFMEDPKEPLIAKIEAIIAKTIDGNGKIIDKSDCKPFNHFVSLRNQGVMNRDFSDLYSVSETENTGLHPTVGSTFSTMLSTPDKERGSIISTCVNKLSIFKDPRVRKNIQRSDITPRDIMDDRVSLYLITPPKAIKMTRPLFRLIITQTIYELTDKMNFDNRKKIDKEIDNGWKIIKKDILKFNEKIRDFFKEKYKKEEVKNKRVLFLIDEFPALGNLALLEIALAYLAGFGLKVLMITQSINQLRKIYGKDNSIIDNCHTQLYFTPNDETTPDMICKMLGKKTLKITTRSGNGLSMNNRSESYISRDLMTSSEIRTMAYEKILVFVSGKNPILGKKIFWWKHDRFKDNTNYNIPYKSYLNFIKELEVNGLDEYTVEYLIYLKKSYKILRNLIDKIGEKEFIKELLRNKIIEEELNRINSLPVIEVEKIKKDIIDKVILKIDYETEEEFKEDKKLYFKEFTDSSLEKYLKVNYYRNLDRNELEQLLENNLETIENKLEYREQFRMEFMSFLSNKGIRDSLTPLFPEYFIIEVQKIRKSNENIGDEIFNYIALNLIKDKKDIEINFDSILKNLNRKYNSNNLELENIETIGE